MQTYRMGNSFPNPVYVDDILLASADVNLMTAEKRSSCPQKSNLGRVTTRNMLVNDPPFWSLKGHYFSFMTFL